MIKLMDILNEGIKENAALEYLEQLVQSGPFRGRVFLAGGAVRDMELGKDPKDLDIVVTGQHHSLCHHGITHLHHFFFAGKITTRKTVVYWPAIHCNHAVHGSSRAYRGGGQHQRAG